MDERREPLPVEGGRTERPKHRGLRRLLIFLAVLAAVLGVVALAAWRDGTGFDALRRYFAYGTGSGSGAIRYEASTANRFAALDGGVAILSDRELTVLRDDGAEVCRLSLSLGSPALVECRGRALAYDVGGSVMDFVKQMNARAQELGCTGTNFTCAHGLFDYGNVSTAQDLAKIAAACAANQTFAQVAGTASYVLPATNLRKAEHTISSSNSLMNSESSNYREYVRWVKGGFTTLAGRCIVAFAEKDGHTYGLVILGCDTLDHLFAECDDLFDWAFESFADRPLVDTQTELTTVALTKCRTEPAVALYAAAPVSGYGHADDIVTYSFDLPESVSATVKSGSVIGSATVYLDGYEVGTVDLVTHKEYVSDFRTDMKATVLLLCALVLILFAMMVLTLAASGGSLNLKRRKRRR